MLNAVVQRGFDVFLPFGEGQPFDLGCLLPARELGVPGARRGGSNLRGSVRLEPTRNNQKRRVRLAEDYLIDRWTAKALCEQIGTPAPLKVVA